jgi:glycosyltransferase involved in cell wall biosynthesis
MTSAPGPIRVLRVYHGGRDRQHRGRERALIETGVDVTLVVPKEWPDAGAEGSLSQEAFPIVEIPVRRAGNVNRHVYVDAAATRRLVDQTRPDVLDIHEEPFSAVAQQWLAAAGGEVPVVMYTAQNVDKRYPPPFSRYERVAHRRAAAFYPCSRQAASVLRGKGFTGAIDVLDLGYDDAVFQPGTQSLDSSEVVLALVGRLVPEKGVADAVRVLARVHAVRPARLILRGEGPEAALARDLASDLGVADRLDVGGWQGASELATTYRRAHVVLVPSYPTGTWTEQFGRVVVEGQACGAVVAGYASGAIAEVAGEAAVIVPTGDVAGLGDGVTRLLSDPLEFASRREAGWREAAGRTWRAVAARQASLYAAACRGVLEPVRLPSSPRERRQVARAEFGPTAPTLVGNRPFALPILRSAGPVAGALATVGDAAAELVSRLQR